MRRLLESAMRDLLNSPLPGRGAPTPCQCAGCISRREEGLHCVQCGYAGPPALGSCSCNDDRRDRIRMNRVMLREAPLTIDQRNILRDAVAIDLDNLGLLCSLDAPECGHGAPTCPVCGHDGKCVVSEAESLRHAWAMVREMRMYLQLMEPAAGRERTPDGSGGRPARHLHICR